MNAVKKNLRSVLLASPEKARISNASQYLSEEQKKIADEMKGQGYTYQRIAETIGKPLRYVVAHFQPANSNIQPGYFNCNEYYCWITGLKWAASESNMRPVVDSRPAIKSKGY